MKALTLTQPWATLVAIGAKRIETRSWTSSYRGPLAIHAAKGFPRWAKELCAEEPYYAVLQAHGQQWMREHHGKSPRCVFENPVLPLGMIVAVARLVGVERTEHVTAQSQGLLKHEIDFGDYGDGRFGWLLTNVMKLPTPIACKGALGLWTVAPDIAERVLEECT